MQCDRCWKWKGAWYQRVARGLGHIPSQRKLLLSPRSRTFCIETSWDPDALIHWRFKVKDEAGFAIDAWVFA